MRGIHYPPIVVSLYPVEEESWVFCGVFFCGKRAVSAESLICGQDIAFMTFRIFPAPSYAIDFFTARFHWSELLTLLYLSD